MTSAVKWTLFLQVLKRPGWDTWSKNCSWPQCVSELWFYSAALYLGLHGLRLTEELDDLWPLTLPFFQVQFRWCPPQSLAVWRCLSLVVCISTRPEMSIHRTSSWSCCLWDSWGKDPPPFFLSYSLALPLSDVFSAPISLSLSVNKSFFSVYCMPHLLHSLFLFPPSSTLHYLFTLLSSLLFLHILHSLIFKMLECESSPQHRLLEWNFLGV